MKVRDALLFGYAAHAQSAAARKRMAEFAVLLGKLCGVDIALSLTDSYDQLARRTYKKAFDLAWLPPIPFIALEKKARVVPLVQHNRGGTSQFHSVILVPTTSRIRSVVGLRGKRAAWVDPHSAAGFVIPRVHLAALGVDPRTAFPAQKFYGTHEAVVRAVVGGRVDFGATYARLDRTGGAVDGAWANLPGAEESVRVLVAFGKIPADVVCARADLDPETRERVVKALIGICHDVKGSMIVRDLFGVHEFRRWVPTSYDALRAATYDAYGQGLLDATKIEPVG